MTQIQGFKDFLNETFKFESTSVDDNKNKNIAEYSKMLRTMTDDVNFGLVDEEKKLCLDGDAGIAWCKLKKFERQIITSRVKLVNQFINLKLQKLPQDPNI